MGSWFADSRGNVVWKPVQKIKKPTDQQISAWLSDTFSGRYRDFFTPEQLVEEIDEIGLEYWPYDWPKDLR